MSGVLIVNKPAGLTSHDVVNVVRRLVGTRKVGHTGTLDPMATGVLVLLIGAATRLSRFAGATQKRYSAVLRLGQTTTTYDADGEITDERPVDVNLEQVENVLHEFQGDIQQVPPMYAAIRVNGKRLYELAREGKRVERQPRPVTVQRIEILNWHRPELELDIVCSPGTYVRSLAHDLGQRLGCGAHLTTLTRIANGPFTLEDSFTLDDLRALAAKDQLASALLPPYVVLSKMPVTVVSRSEEQAIRYGQQVSVSTTSEVKTGEL
ncbi:MAG: tRNA pseudouridine(55) synthase TruB, partial [Anaerolineae bacterium]